MLVFFAGNIIDVSREEKEEEVDYKEKFVRNGGFPRLLADLLLSLMAVVCLFAYVA